MDKKLTRVLDILGKLNSKVNIVTKKDLEEQYENLEDFKSLTNDLDVLLNKFNSVNKDNGEKTRAIWND